VSPAPRHPPPPAANPHPGWGEGDANYPGSGSARPSPPPRPTRPAPGRASPSSPAPRRWRAAALPGERPPGGGPPPPGRGAGDSYTTGGRGPDGEGGRPAAAQPEAGTATGPRRRSRTDPAPA
jgi:hypothetical protein